MQPCFQLYLGVTDKHTFEYVYTFELHNMMIWCTYTLWDDYKDKKITSISSHHQHFFPFGHLLKLKGGREEEKAANMDERQSEVLRKEGVVF